MYKLCGYDFTSMHCHLFYFLQWRMLSNKEGRRKKGVRKRQRERESRREGRRREKLGRKEGKVGDSQREACVSYWSFAKSRRFALDRIHHVCRSEELYSRSKMGADLLMNVSVSNSSLLASLRRTYQHGTLLLVDVCSFSHAYRMISLLIGWHISIYLLVCQSVCISSLFPNKDSFSVVHNFEFLLFKIFWYRNLNPSLVHARHVLHLKSHCQVFVDESLYLLQTNQLCSPEVLYRSF